MKINKYLIPACIYFFLDAAGLPFGLTYMVMLSPLLYLWATIRRKKELLLPYCLVLLPFIVMHSTQQVDARSYCISLLHYTLVYMFVQACYTFFKFCKNPETIFRKLLVANFVFCLLSIPIYFTDYAHLLWMDNPLTNGAGHMNRLRLLTYEPSYLAVLFVPLFFYFFVQLVLRQNKMNSWLLLCMLFVPLLLSFSFGVISCIAIAFLATFLLYARQLLKRQRLINLLALGSCCALIACILFHFFFPDNTLLLRFADIINGTDTSAKGRTYEAFDLAKQIIALKSSAWGVGAGQIKTVGGDIIRSYYLYPLEDQSIALPNAAAETLAIFGWLGLLLRLAIQVGLFFYTRVWSNYYRLLLFVFMFVYQFTGSFITNLAEYVIWVLAFTNVFAAFDVRLRKKIQSYSFSFQ